MSISSIPQEPVSESLTSGPGTSVLREARPQRMNATFVTLCRNSDLWDIIKSMQSVNDRFNDKYHYDWVFLKEEPFDETFKNFTSGMTAGKVFYGLIPEDQWSYPDWIDQDKAKDVRVEMANQRTVYGGSESYRFMCRYESGFFFRHPLMLNYEFYWRVEPGTEYFCNLPFDPFHVMKEGNKKYSFVLTLFEWADTIPSLWDSVKKYMANHPEHIVPGNSMDIITNDGGNTYNLCHFVCLLSLPLFFFR